MKGEYAFGMVKRNGVAVNMPSAWLIVALRLVKGEW